MSSDALRALLVAAVVLLGVTGCAPGPGATAGAPATTAQTDGSAPVSLDPETGLLGDDDAAAVVAAAPPATALAALVDLPVQGRAPTTGYDRDLFGAGWVDTDGNGCDTRNDVLARDLTEEQFKPGTRDCVVASGMLADPYSGTTIAFTRGQGTSELVQVDHVVALSNSWQTGAQGWDADRRAQFANDPLNLLAVDGGLNQQKGDGDTATWLPPNTSYRCAYVARQVAVKVGYGLWTTQAEHNAMATILAGCPDQPLPDGSAVPTQEQAPEPTTAPAPGVGFDSCADARAAGAAPVRVGDPGYRTGLDGDGDGIACE